LQPITMTPSSEPIRPPVVQEYSRLAADYDTRWSAYVEATTRQTIARLDVRPTDRLLDVGCGTGVLLQRIAQDHAPALLEGVDPVPQMLAVARRRLAADVRLCQAWAEHLPFRDADFDVVASCNMLHYVSQPILALREMHRVLRPGGRLVITDWCAGYLVSRCRDRLLRLFNRAHVRVFHEREIRQLLAQISGDRVTIDTYRVGWRWGMMTVIVTKQLHDAAA
jgi:ubiquinone/menaquinone biosynthesis C-methylase UbiE